MINSEPDAGNRLEAVARHSEIKASRKHDSPQQPPQKVPSFTTTSEWDQPELGQSSLDTQMAAGARFLEGLNGSEACPDLYPQSMDLDTLVGGMVGELDDSREGSPCRRAATELLLPGSFGADVQPGEAQPPVSSQGYGAPRQDNLAGFPGQAQWMPNSFQQQPPWAPGGPGLWEPDRQRQAWYQQSAQLSQHPDSYSGRQQQTSRSAQQAGFQQHTQQAQAGSQQGDQIVPGGNSGPPGMSSMAPACEGDWLTSIMDQALSVGLWGGSASPRLGEQSKPQQPSGAPGLQNAIRSKGPAGLQVVCMEPLPSISFYQAEMEAMLPQQCGPKEQGGALEAGVGHISRELQLQPSQPPQEGASKTPRLPPVSLGMTSNSLSDMLACSAKMGMNDGPFRPPTRPPAGKANKVAGSSKFNAPQPSMLQQSRLQLSLGLDAETPIDLRSWGYGEESNTTAPGQGDDSACVSSGLQEDGHMAVDATRTSDSCSVDLSGLMPISSSVSLPAIKIGISLSDSRHNSITLAPKAPGLASPRHIWDNGCVTDGEGRDRLPGSKARRPAAEEAAATRAECLERYREKKRRRLIHKTIRYHKRKVNADNRPRIKGRFVKSADSKQDSGMEVEGTTVDGQPQEEEQAGHDLLGEPVKVPPISGSTLTRA